MTQTNLSCDNSWCACGYVFCLKIKITNLKFLTMIRIGNSMICSDIFHKYHECDISKLLYVASRAVRRVKFETILRYHEWYLCQMSTTNHAIICSCYYRNVREYHLIFESKRKKQNTFMTQTNLSCENSWCACGYLSAWVVVGRVGVAMVLFISTIGGGKVADWLNGVCWGIGPKHFQR